MEIDRTKSNIIIKAVKRISSKKRQLTKQKKAHEKELLSGVNLVIGMDNGATGTVCAWFPQKNIIDFRLTPAKTVKNYQQDLKYIDRIDHEAMKQWLQEKIDTGKRFYEDCFKVILILERPMVNPQRFESSLNAVRAFQALIVILQQLSLEYIVIDSKKWQHEFFGKNTTFINLKLESMKTGISILKEFNQSAEMIQTAERHGDADALLMAKFCIDKLIK